MSALVISLDFELFWGVGAAHSVASYGRNVQGEWLAVPKLLGLFRRYGIRASWATVGMVMCRNYKEWHEIRPSAMPGYRHSGVSSYVMDKLVRDKPGLFFARPLVEQILATPGQELATHTYSHFYCSEDGVTPEQFAADLACASVLAADLGVRCRSLVFPRNQIVGDFLDVLPEAGIEVYRGTQRHWLYRNGDTVAGGIAGRALRFADACLPLSGSRVEQVGQRGRLVNVPASLFLYPWSRRQGSLVPLRLHRIKQCMTRAARTGGICHIWWHPHNFGVDTERNLALLEVVLQHYRMLADRYGMLSHCMGDFAVANDAAEKPEGKLRSRTAAVVAGATWRKENA